MVSNITAVYNLATENERLRGARWYPLAHTIVIEWADTFKRSIANVACIVAALSPQMSWERNLIVALDILHLEPPSIGGHIRSFVEKAERIREDHATQLDGYFKVGCKVRSFAANLAGNFQIVTVDTHGAQIAAGSLTANLRIGQWKEYEPVARAYVDAAERIGILPSELQAITWLTWKRLYPTNQKSIIRRKW